MNITLNITADSKVSIVRDNCEAVQNESNVTILTLNFPSTIKGYSIDNYTKQIEFGECKELGQCKKFLDTIDGDTYTLNDICTQFKKILIQFTLKNLTDEDDVIIWKTIPFALEFCESINAENTVEVQANLLSLAEIEAEWENDLNTTKAEWEEFIKANALKIFYNAENVPTADADSLDDTIFYLGVNTTAPYTLTYGHYYRCTLANDVYAWTDLIQDPSLEDVANGIREVNNSQSMQLWVGTKAELENEVTQDNVMYIPEDESITETFDEVLTQMSEDDNLAYPIKEIVEGELDYKSKYIPLLNHNISDSDDHLKYSGKTIPTFVDIYYLQTYTIVNQDQSYNIAQSYNFLTGGDILEFRYVHCGVIKEIKIKLSYDISDTTPITQKFEEAYVLSENGATSYIVDTFRISYTKKSLGVAFVKANVVSSNTSTSGMLEVNSGTLAIMKIRKIFE